MNFYERPELPYDPAALEPQLSARIIELHHDKHHAAYVKGANAALVQLHEARQNTDLARITMLEKDLAFHVSGHVLHSLYWTNLSPDGGGEPAGVLGELIEATFGSFAAFRRQLTAAAGTVQGSGWGVLTWEPLARRLVIQQVYDHQCNHVNGAVPLLAIDAWEHAFYLQYENRKADYLDAIWNIVNWDDVTERLRQARAVPHREPLLPPATIG